MITLLRMEDEEGDDGVCDTSALNIQPDKSKSWDTDELAVFRSQWKEELGLESRVGERGEGQPPIHEAGKTERGQSPSLSINSQGSKDVSPVKTAHASDEPKDEATSLYLMGVAAEQSGDMNGAVLYYRQALQLDPDVEFRASQTTSSSTGKHEEGLVEAETCECGGLAADMEGLSISSLCSPQRQVQGAHISDLPAEVLRYIFRWVVSSLLDMRALEQVAMVCKGFYILAREPSLWRMACKRLWVGDTCQPGSYSSWRRMYILRPHLHFNGVYISKTSYVRTGEHSLDGFYKPYHTVTYYRYLHFFPDGAVMYQTAPDEPALVVGRLCHKHSSDSILLGRYSVSDRTVTIDLASDNRHSHHQHHQRGRGRHKQQAPTQEYRFRMELLLSKRKTKQMTWVSHSCTTVYIATGEEQLNEFEINYMYTPFYFSCVKSFAQASNSMLQ